jgi:4-hydroxybenzoyl-CoA thioesterase
MERFFSEYCGVPYDQLITKNRLGFPTVSVNAQFKEPIRYGDNVEVWMDVVNLSRRSITFNYRLVRALDSVQCATVTMVHVAMNLDSRRSIEIPETIRQRLERAHL